MFCNLTGKCPRCFIYNRTNNKERNRNGKRYDYISSLKTKLESINDTTNNISKKLDNINAKLISIEMTHEKNKHHVDKRISLIEYKESGKDQWWKKVIGFTIQTASIILGAWCLNKLGIAPTSP